MPDDAVGLGDLSALADGELRCFEHVGEYGIIVCRVAGELHALEDNCSHADTPLSEGRLRGVTVTCPLHGASFDVRDGSHTSPPAWAGVASYRVEETVEGAVVHLRGDGPGADDGFGGVGGTFRMR